MCEASRVGRRGGGRGGGAESIALFTAHYFKAKLFYQTIDLEVFIMRAQNINADVFFNVTHRGKGTAFLQGQR